MTKYQIGISYDGDRVCHLFPTQFTEPMEAMACANMRFGTPTKGWELGGNPDHFPAHFWPDGHWTNDESAFCVCIFILQPGQTLSVAPTGTWDFTGM